MHSGRWRKCTYPHMTTRPTSAIHLPSVHAAITSDRRLLAFRDVSKTFPDGTEALRGLELDIREREFVSFLGPSGCGKSTALRLIAGLSEPSSGHIEWSGREKYRQTAEQRDIGFVFQEPTLMPWSTVFDNVYLPLRLSGISRKAAEQRISEAIDLVGLNGFSGSYPRQLSGGMKMRVSIARAVVTRPRVLLLDEPFAALDEITRFRLNNDLLRLKAALGWTVLFVTHSVYESVYLSSRIIVMAARPGRNIGEISIDAPFPRDGEFRTSSDYANFCRRVSDMLHRAMTGGAMP